MYHNKESPNAPLLVTQRQGLQERAAVATIKFGKSAKARALRAKAGSSTLLELSIQVFLPCQATTDAAQGVSANVVANHAMAEANEPKGKPDEARAWLPLSS